MRGRHVSAKIASWKYAVFAPPCAPEVGETNFIIVIMNVNFAAALLVSPWMNFNLHRCP